MDLMKVTQIYHLLHASFSATESNFNPFLQSLIALELFKAGRWQISLMGQNSTSFFIQTMVLEWLTLNKTLQYAKVKNTENKFILAMSYICGCMNQTCYNFCFKSLKSIESPERELTRAVFSMSGTICCIESWIWLKQFNAVIKQFFHNLFLNYEHFRVLKASAWKYCLVIWWNNTKFLQRLIEVFVPETAELSCFES